MGTSSSRNCCPYCTTHINIHSIPENNVNTNVICGRCHGSIKKNESKRSRIPFSSSNNIIIKNTHILNQIELKYIHIFPFINNFEYIKSEQKIDEISDDYLINNYLKPYFVKYPNTIIHSQHRLVINSIEFKVINCYPPNGIITENTQFIMNDNNNKLLTFKYRPIKQIHILPTKCSVKSHNISIRNSNNLYEELLTPYLFENDTKYYVNNSDGINTNKRHLTENETFIYKNIQWTVMKCQPIDGYINSETTIYCNGISNNDLKMIHIRPKYNMLPESQKQWCSEHIQKEYIYPMTLGTYLYFNSDNINDIIINGVQFMVYGLQPQSGIITCQTRIDSKPIDIAEIIHIEQQRDLDFALRLQQQEYDNILGGMNMVNQMLLFESIQNNEENENENENINININNNNLRNRLRELNTIERIRRENKGLSEQLINILPTYKYSIKTANYEIDKCKEKGKGNDDGDINSCRICLEEYEDDDIIKILPCFHKYHKMCVDNWLIHSIKCPICNNSIFN